MKGAIMHAYYTYVRIYLLWYRRNYLMGLGPEVRFENKRILSGKWKRPHVCCRNIKRGPADHTISRPWSGHKEIIIVIGTTVNNSGSTIFCMLLIIDVSDDYLRVQNGIQRPAYNVITIMTIPL